MEKKFYQDNFEQFLKESTENFRMYPSKRVWHSIYNNLHPGRRWPSLAVWLLLVSSIIFIGLSNKNNITGATGNNAVAATDSKPTLTAKTTNDLPASQDNIAIGQADHIPTVLPAQKLVDAGKADNNATRLSHNRNNDHSSKNTNQSFNHLVAANNDQGLQQNKASLINQNDKDITREINTGSFVSNNAKISMQSPEISNTNIIGSDDNTQIPPLITAETKKADAEKKQPAAVAKKTNTTDKEWIEDYAFHNKPTISKWKSRASYQIYLTPSIGYRVLSNNTNFNPVYSSLVASPGNSQDYKDALSQGAAVNMELGGSILYSLSKNWNLKFGLQLNYTNYAVNAYELRHPTMTTLLLNDLNNGMPILDPRPTSLANTSGVSTKKLKNNTYQVSIPIGADLKIAGKGNLKWYVGGTIQPTYVAGGHAYLISSDLKNYVADNSFMRKWNLNAAVETFISYKTPIGVIINAGPQFRYQFLSTNRKQYTYEEKLYNMGIKIGITTRF